MIVIQLAQTANPFHGIFVTKMAADGITGIGGVHHQSTFADDFTGLFNQPWLGVIGVYLKKLTHANFRLSCCAHVDQIGVTLAGKGLILPNSVQLCAGL